MEELGSTIQPARSSLSDTLETDTISSRILACAGFDAVTIDELVGRSGLTAEALSVILLQLELDGRVSSLPGGRYQRLAAERL